MSLPPKTRLKTYWHLGTDQRAPTDYEVVSSRLLWYVERGFELPVPLAEWFDRHQRSSPLRSDDWERFRDPRQTTYSDYVRLQSRQESFVEQLLQSMDDRGHDARLSADCLALIEQLVAPLRFPLHGLQMLAAYVGQMAPSGRITICAAFQAADEARRLQLIAYRTAQLRRVRPDFGERARDDWQKRPLWQPLRRLIEELLVCWDWGESFCALNLCLKPCFDQLFMIEAAGAARENGDYALAELFSSLDADCRWHRSWALSLARSAIAARSDNRAVLRGWIEKWGDRAGEAVAPLLTALARSPASAETAVQRALSALEEV